MAARSGTWRQPGSYQVRIYKNRAFRFLRREFTRKSGHAGPVGPSDDDDLRLNFEQVHGPSSHSRSLCTARLRISNAKRHAEYWIRYGMQKLNEAVSNQRSPALCAVRPKGRMPFSTFQIVIKNLGPSENAAMPAHEPIPLISILEPSRCPLCGALNACAMETARETSDPAEPCWCMSTTFTPALLERIPPGSRSVACICARCAALATTTTTTG